MILVGGPKFDWGTHAGWALPIDADRLVELMIDDNNIYAIRITNGQKTTSLALTEEAAAALMELLLVASPNPLPPHKEGGDE